MTTTSYPAVGTNGLTETQWAVLFGDQDGIVQDFCIGGAPACALTLSGDTATIGVGRVKVNNYLLDISAAHDLTLPPVSSTTIYYIAAQYDPALNVADGSGNASSDGPCRLVVTAGTPVTTGGKVYTTLYAITRNPSQALTAAAVADCREWQGPTLTLPAIPTGSPAGFGPFPRGTHLWVVPAGSSLGEHFLMDLVGVVGAQSLGWRSLTVDTARPFPFPSSLVSRDGSPSTPQFYAYAGCMIGVRGTLKRTSGSLSSGSDVVLGTFPVGSRPAFTVRFICKVGPGKDYGEVRVGGGNGTSSGVVTLTGDSGIDWVDISPINFRAEF